MPVSDLKEFFEYKRRSGVEPFKRELPELQNLLTRHGKGDERRTLVREVCEIVGNGPVLIQLVVEFSARKWCEPAIMLFPTNGLLPEVIRDRTEEILARCPKSTIVVKLSLDGLDGAHDALRNRPGSFDKAMQTYHMLEGLIDKYPNFELGINTVFCSENQNGMDAIIDFVSGLKNIKTHTISLVRGNLADAHYKRVDYHKYNQAIERLEKNLKNTISSIYRFKGARVKAAQDIVQRRLIYQTACEQKRIIPCYAGRLNVVLGESGDVYPCEMLADSFGNIRKYDYDVGRVMRSEKARKIIDAIRANQCYCTHECYSMTNILFNPKLYPALAKEYLQFTR